MIKKGRGDSVHLAWWIITAIVIVLLIWLIPLVKRNATKVRKQRRERREYKTLQAEKPNLAAIREYIARVQAAGGSINVDMNVAYVAHIDALKQLETALTSTDYKPTLVDDVVDYIMPTSLKILQSFKLLDTQEADAELRGQAIRNLELATEFLKKTTTAVLKSLELDLSTDEDVLKWYGTFD